MNDLLQPNLGNVDKFYIASRLQCAIESTFAHWDDLGERCVDQRYRALLEELDQSRTRTSFSLALMRYMASFRNAHTEFVDFSLLPSRQGAFPIRLREIKGDWYVMSSSVKGLEPADKIEQVNGRDAATFFSDYLPYVAASRPEYRGYSLFSKLNGLPSKITLAKECGTLFELDRSANHLNRNDTVSSTEFSDHALIRIPSFDDPKFEEDAVEAVRRFGGKRYIVIDVRGNGGGDTPRNLIDAVMDRPHPGWIESSSSRTGLEIAETFPRHEGKSTVNRTPRSTITWSTGWHQPSETAYSGKLVIFVDVGCKSATEDFLLPLVATQRALVIGETTAGSSGQPYVESPYDEMLFTVGAKRQFFPDMTPLEGRGIRPDIEVDPLKALRGGIDFYLKIAREEMHTAGG